MDEIRLEYEGTDISDECDISTCVFTDNCGAESDAAEIIVSGADRWMRWRPQPGDRLKLTKGKFSSGKLYLNSIEARGNDFRIFATARRPQINFERWLSFEDRKLNEVFRLNAAEMGLESELYGVDENITYPYLQRRGMSAPRFLEDIMRREGAFIKACEGRLNGIGALYAQGLAPAASIYLDKRDERYALLKRSDTVIGGVRVAGVRMEGEYAALPGLIKTYYDLNPTSEAEAYRWAKGLYQMSTLTRETLLLDWDFLPQAGALTRLDATHAQEGTSRWLCLKAEHDLIGESTRIRAARIDE